ncbi:glycosyltransferase family 2 protein [Leptothoe sp. PORK10 BA2]|uniref:glycosyltransferase family 2 protein n=1 Tax=Leptothoe sp. PORK10 BA2 TaxID=3110254 RepID=UPI002B20C614|nr:glycosyltransferase family 2 protein [Leptothoe sp. PORK10 BA2]MEA5464686.1 glycosyltransferase family 2 protein [Leptothoe sp. PORK10 BA2]
MSLKKVRDCIKLVVYIIIPIHNRQTITLKCLAELIRQDIFSYCTVVIVDDGCTDGSLEAITIQYPQVKVIKGDGNLWWTGAIKLGMEYAYKKGADYFIWLNDDTLPAVGAISTLIDTCVQHQPCAVAAQCYETKRYQQPTYGGQQRIGLTHKPLLPPRHGEVDCDSLSGNLTCIPRSAVDKVGFPPAKKLPHYQGDTVYTWRLKQVGFRLLVTDRARAQCSKNPGSPSWLRSDTAIIELWKQLFSPKSSFYIPGFWHFCITFWGPLGMLVFIRSYSRLGLISLIKWIIPKTLLRMLIVSRS